MSIETKDMVVEFDAAMQAHIEWSQQILRCTILHEAPEDDLLSPVAHTLCRFGKWFASKTEYFEALDMDSIRRVTFIHQNMHDSIRSICNNVMNGEPGNTNDLDNFQSSQSEFIDLIEKLKTLVISNAAQNDPLTGLPLRHGIAADFSICQKDAVRNNSVLYVAMIDIDNVKTVNDIHGHPAGDIALRNIANALKQTLRSNDPLYRFGGEEFLCLIRCQSAEEVSNLANRFLIAIATNPIPIGDAKTLSITVTIGLARVSKNETIDSATKRADIALYEGKSNGRNQYVISAT